MVLVNQSEWAPHAEKAFGHFTYAMGRYGPRKFEHLRSLGKQIRALPAPKSGKLKR